MATHRADEKRFLDDRYSTVPVCPNGLNPATILEKPVRERIVDSYFWKDQCFALNEADIVSRCVSHVTFIGGTYGISQRPSPFICLVFKLLQLAPSDEILKEYIGYGGEKFKYLRALGLFYVRITRGGKEVYEWLEGCLGDRRKLKRRGRDGVRLTFVDEFVDEMLTKERVCGTSLWKLPKREVLEDLEVLEPRVSELGDIEELLAEEDDDVEEVRNGDGDESERSPGEEFGEEVVEDTGERMDVDSADKGDDASRGEGL
jgi:pre-mRNA-splicing factor 38A